MTHRQYKRLRDWDRRTQPAYNAGVIEGMDAFFAGYPRPEDPDVGHDPPFDLRFLILPGDRLEQYYRNNQRARMRGAVDGWDQASQMQADSEREEQIEAEVEQGMNEIAAFLLRKAA